jgi:hypothetical protein
MQQLLTYKWADVADHANLRPYLEVIVGKSRLTRNEAADEQQQSLFTMRYAAREVVMPAGVFGECAALLLGGSVDVFGPAPAGGGRARDQGCWDRPGPLG